jgi:hypothetical protein
MVTPPREVCHSKQQKGSGQCWLTLPLCWSHTRLLQAPSRSILPVALWSLFYSHPSKRAAKWHSSRDEELEFALGPTRLQDPWLFSSLGCCVGLPSEYLNVLGSQGMNLVGPVPGRWNPGGSDCWLCPPPALTSLFSALGNGSTWNASWRGVKMMRWTDRVKCLQQGLSIPDDQQIFTRIHHEAMQIW